MAFQPYKRSGRPTADPDTVLLGHSLISIGPSLFEALGEPERVQLLFDPDKRIVGLQTASEEVTGLKVRDNRAVTARGFYDAFGIEERGRFTGVVKDGTLHVHLKTSRV